MLTVKRKLNGVPSFVNIFEDFLNTDAPTKTFENKGEFVPSVNVSENQKEFKLEFAIPGFEKKDFDVNIEKDLITITGKKVISSEVTENKYTRKEFSMNSFSRVFNLPENVETEKIEAVYVNGILNLVLPKKELKVNTGNKKVEIK